MKMAKVLLGVAALATVAACGTDEPDVGHGEWELSAAQCSYFAVDDKVTLCHRTSSVRNPYVVIRTNVAGCNGHDGHITDYIAAGDATCNGLGCFPEGAPYDGSVECCEGLTAVDGVCRAACVDLDDGNACTDDFCTPTGSIHAAIAVDDGDACTVDVCDPATGAVSHTSADVDDGNVCTVDACDPAVGVVHVAVSVNDGNVCTVDSCDPEAGVSHVTQVDLCPFNEEKTAPGVCGCNLPEDATCGGSCADLTDTDGDGVPDCVDMCWGVADGPDVDGDGLPACYDACPLDVYAFMADENGACGPVCTPTSPDLTTPGPEGPIAGPDCIADCMQRVFGGET
jgi:hypothetical protein